MPITEECRDFDAFLVKVLKKIKDSNTKIDYWIGAAEVAFGSKKLKHVLSRLGKGFGDAAGPTTTSGSAVLGGPVSLSGTVVGATSGPRISMGYLKKARTEEGGEIAENLRSAKYLFEEYVSSSISDEEKMILIDDLFKRLVAGEKITS